KAHERPNCPLVRLLAHRNSARARLVFERAVPARGMRDRGPDDWRLVTGAVRDCERRYPVCLVRDLAELIALPAKNAVAHRARARRQTVRGLFGIVGADRIGGASLYRLLPLHLSGARSCLI